MSSLLVSALIPWQDELMMVSSEFWATLLHNNLQTCKATHRH